MSYPFPLEYFQKKLYVNKCRLYKPDYKSGHADDDTTFSPAYDDVPCLFYVKTAVDVVVPGGLLESGDLLTMDQIHFASAQPIGSGWLVMQLSYLPDGVTRHPEYGRVWVVTGDPDFMSGSAVSRTDRTVAYIARLSQLPEGVTPPP